MLPLRECVERDDTRRSWSTTPKLRAVDYTLAGRSRELSTRRWRKRRFITAHVALPCPIHGEPLTDEQLGQGLGDLAIETEKSAVWFLVVVVIAAAALVDGCSCPSRHSGGAPNNLGTQPPGGGKP
ncbi:hypothetical protein [Nannocystis bainbridge]|uniref:Uncharacterized protein n=1 Tax=Nannocystis bainbridge TaxID=2995303 RepID=A0ABT5EEE7_9BACT|nr:hypothetical protein [Nannocystis bainbridge]MDC0723197.1 hypothetical protein [Nannocystis bainbridge]